MGQFKMGSLDHMHLVVPDRHEAAAWFERNLGFEIVDAYREWAEVEGGPLHVSADGGQSGLALFQAQAGHPISQISIGIAFQVDAKSFVNFAHGLDGSEIRNSEGEALSAASVVDHDLCYAFYFQDPWDNAFELDCYDHARVKRDLVEAQGIQPVRFW